MAKHSAGSAAINLKVEPVATGLGFPEGPVAWKDGSLLFVDIQRGTLCRLDRDGKRDDLVELGGGPNGLAIGPDGRTAFVCNNGGVYTFVTDPRGPVPITLPSPLGPPKGFVGGSIQTVDLETGKVETLYDSCNGKRLLTPDDIVFDGPDTFWFTDSGVQDPETLKKGGVYRARTDGSLIERMADIPTANGIGIAADRKIVYVTDTLFGRLWALDLDKNGAVKKHPILGTPGRVVYTLPGLQWLDSLKLDPDGNICAGTLITGGITVFSPDGTSARHYGVPDLMTTNLCFGGKDGHDVWITASSTGTIYKTRWPWPT
jgi:gluconolactonase